MATRSEQKVKSLETKLQTVTEQRDAARAQVKFLKSVIREMKRQTREIRRNVVRLKLFIARRR